MPEVRFGREELHSQILLAVARPVDGDNPALHRLRSMIVHQDERLSHQHDFFEMKQRPVPVHRLRMGLDTELLTGIRFSADRQRDRQRYPLRPPAFFAAKMKQGHLERRPQKADL